MTLILDKPVQLDKPAVHVLIVAVGNYPYLLGGSGALFGKNSGMGQLSSPPVSARRICDWLMHDFVPYGANLSSIDVLVSGEQDFVGETGSVIAVESATVPNLRLAARRFFSRSDRNPNDTLVFYFSGHGVSSGEVHSLLLEGFGGDPLDPFSDAVDAGAFIDGMRKCKALNQLFLFDACRTVPQDYLLELGNNRGMPLVSGASHANLGVSKQVSLWASELGLPAYGRIGAATIFAEALLIAMQGAAARRDLATFKWVIETYSLQEGINTVIRRLVGATRQFVTPGRMTMGFPLHVLAGDPVVPVDIFCRPEIRGPQLELACSPGAFRYAGAPWYLELPHGFYTVTATELGSGSLVNSQPCLAVPPSAMVMLEV